MKRKLQLVFTIMVLFGMVLAPFLSISTASAVGANGENLPNRPARNPQPVPQEIVDLFEGGMTIDEFLALNQGQPVPQALLPLMDKPMVVIVEMEGDPLAIPYAKSLERNTAMSTAAQQSYIAALLEAQAPVVSTVQSLGGTVIDQYTKAYNGLLVSISAKNLDTLRKLPGVKSVQRAPEHTISLTSSVPLINADVVSNTLGYDGTGVTIAVIDTGIDYTHAALGGSGDPNDYTIEISDTTVVSTTFFPNFKVIGGYDFAGTDYDAGGTITQTIPMPDPDPIDENGHGTHVAATAAGIGSASTGVGVAPGASLYALKVFGKDGSTNLVTSAIEWAMDPNGDGDLSDRVDVINMSLGASFGTDRDASAVASTNASLIGVMVVASAGNSGNTSYITGSPATGDGVLSVAASTTGFATGPTVNVSGTTFITQTNIIYQPPAFDNGTGRYTTAMTATLSYVGVYTASDELCGIAGLPANVLSGTIALIQRGGCAFSDKVNNAAALGAVGAIIFNDAARGDARVTMAGAPVAIPAGFVGHTNGVDLSAAHGQTVIVSAEDDVSTVPDVFTPPDTIASFSSRGPRGFDSALKPEIAAPGVGIFAADMGSGTGGVALSGTSMAAPHVAGVAALVRQAHPGWTPEEVKAALMNTAVITPSLGGVPLSGAGRVDALGAVTADTLVSGNDMLVSLSWGVLTSNSPFYTSTMPLTIRSYTSTTRVYSVTWGFDMGSYTDSLSLSVPATVTVGPGTTNIVPVVLSYDATSVPNALRTLEEYYGFITLTNTANIADVLRVPFYALPKPVSQAVIDGATVGTYTGTLSLTHIGPVSSSLRAYPAFEVDLNGSSVGDEADIRLLGMDFGWTDPTFGDIFIPAINTYGPAYTPQPYVAEFDLYLDVDEDGFPDLVNFNWNYASTLGLTPDDTWVVIQVDLTSGLLFLASPFLIYTDYNYGYQEWYLPAAWNGLGSGNTDFDFFMAAFDRVGNMDLTGAYSFDYARPPFDWDVSNDPGPADHTATLDFSVWDNDGYNYAMPAGLMVVDYNGRPGAGQALFYPVSLTPTYSVYLPIIVR